jgi:hypothetical protein
VRNDNDGLEPLLLEHIPCRVEIMYTDGMNAKIALEGSIEEVSDIAIDDLLTVADEAEQILFGVSEGPPLGTPRRVRLIRWPIMTRNFPRPHGIYLLQVTLQ